MRRAASPERDTNSHFRRKGMIRLTTLAIAAALGLAAGAEAAKDFEWKGKIAGDGVLEIEAISGEIRASLADGEQVEVVAIKHGRRGDFDDVDIEVEQRGSRVTICARYGDRRSGCDKGWDGRHHHHGNQNIGVDIEFEVRLPAGVELEANMVSGDIEARGLRSRVTARSVSGGIDIETSEWADAGTVSGDIRATMDRGDWKGDLDFESVSGDIILTLPEGFGADVEFESLSGDLDSDFEIERRSRRNRFVGAHIRGTIGGGGRSLSLKTVSGDAELRRAR
jgi:hypothetical protein